MLFRSRLPIVLDHFSPFAMQGRLKRLAATLLVVVAFAQTGFTPGAHGGFVLQATSASTTSNVIAGSVNNISNQSGLSTGYTSQVTDFDTYIASSPITPFSAPTTNFATILSANPSIVFDLGGTYTIESIALWTASVNSGAGIKDFQLLASANSSFSSSISLGTFTAGQGPANGSIAAQVFAFAPTSAAFVRLAVTNTYGAPFTNINEVAFEQTVTAVPEPSTLVMFVVAGTLGLVRRRRWVTRK